MRILFATAELRPLVSAGGLGEAAAGLVAGLRRLGHQVTVALPDYSGWDLQDERTVPISVPAWAQPAAARRGIHSQTGDIILISGPGIERPDPYVDADGNGWPDNDLRFAAFAAGVASVADVTAFDVVQLNDWHTSLVPAFLGAAVPTVLTIHNLAHQGWTNVGWLHELPTNRDHYGRGDAVNMLAGAIRTVDAVVTVSPTYAREIVTEKGGMGLHEVLGGRNDKVRGIRNGIDTAAWDPTNDLFIRATYDQGDLGGRDETRAALLEHVGWTDPKVPTIAMVTRLVEQKGVDLAFEVAPYLEGMRARMVVLGSGERRLADWGAWLATEHPDRFWFQEGYDLPLSHLIFAGADLLLMPSRFEPCGLTQMQAMAYGTIPVVTGVGGLNDTVIDADRTRDGNGFVSRSVDVGGVVDALHRALIGWRHVRRRRRIMRLGMEVDWSWDEPAADFVDLYHEVIAKRRQP